MLTHRVYDDPAGRTSWTYSDRATGLAGPLVPSNRVAGESRVTHNMLFQWKFQRL